MKGGIGDLAQWNVSEEVLIVHMLLGEKYLKYNWLLDKKTL